MADGFRPVVRDQLFLLPPSMAEWLPADHEVWFLIDLVEQLDLSGVESSYRLGGRGREAVSPVMLLTLLVYAYSRGLTSSRAIERACSTDIAYRVICGNDPPDHTTIARFRQRHLVAITGVFVEVLGLCDRAGLVQLGTVSIDGTKMRADAALGSNRSVERLREIVTQRLVEAEAVDEAEDDEFGDRRGDEMPAGLVDPAARAAKIAELLAEHDPGADAPGDQKLNLVDPDSRVMSSTRGFVQGFNAQVICGDAQVVLAAGVTNAENDYGALVPMLDTLDANLTAAGIQDALGVLLADAGYFSAANVAALEERGIDALVATRRRGHKDADTSSAAQSQADHEAALVAWQTEIEAIDAAHRAEQRRRAGILDRMTAENNSPQDITEELGVARAVAYRNAAEYRRGGAEGIRFRRRKRPRPPHRSNAEIARAAMAHRLADPVNAGRYKHRSHQVETYFGNLKSNRRILGFTRRGLNAATSEWQFIAMVNNITKLRTGLTALLNAMNPAI